MHRTDVENIFEQKKKSFFEYIIPSDKPLAIILGGQPACGKSALLNIAKKDHADRSFLSVNGDLYRSFHPQNNTLIKNSLKYSSETQIFSNVFTEKLIEEAVRRKSNIIIEGTMRNPDIPLNTATKFKEAGYQVEAYAISAPGLITQLGIYNRFQEEINKKGVGRLSEMNIHNVAIRGIPKSLDALYIQRRVDKISLHTYLAKDRVKDFILDNDSWDCKSLPSLFIEDSRNKQLYDKELLKSLIEKGESLIDNVKDKEIVKEMNCAIQQIKSTLDCAMNKSIKYKM